MSSGLDLAERLQSDLLPDVESGQEPQRSTADRILDAATARFVVDGIAKTTMSSIAADADISREWLYRHFPNRQAIVSAIIQRELQRFIDGLAERAAPFDDPVDALTETFVYCVEFLRDQPLVPGVVADGIPALPGEIRAAASAIVAMASRSCARYLVDLGGFDVPAATTVSETLVRLVGSTVVAPTGALDLADPEVIRDYAARVVPAVCNVG